MFTPTVDSNGFKILLSKDKSRRKNSPSFIQPFKTDMTLAISVYGTACKATILILQKRSDPKTSFAGFISFKNLEMPIFYCDDQLRALREIIQNMTYLFLNKQFR